MRDQPGDHEEPIRVPFLCAGNSARSQLAEALLRHYSGGHFAPASAGTDPAGRIYPLAERALSGVGIALDGQRAKSPDCMCALGIGWDSITTGDQAAGRCPTFPDAAARIHRVFADPARVEGSAEERLGAFRRVRDEIRRRVQLFVALRAHVERGRRQPGGPA